MNAPPERRMNTIRHALPTSLRRRLARTTGLLLVAAAAGCASGPWTAELLAVGGAGLNPTFDGKASAVNIRIVPLVDKAAFDNASDDDLRADPPKLPQGTWTPPHTEAVVYVGQRNRIAVEIKPGVRFVGVFGMFNEETGTRRQVLAVDDLDDRKLVFDAFSVQAAPRAKEDAK